MFTEQPSINNTTATVNARKRKARLSHKEGGSKRVKINSAKKELAKPMKNSNKSRYLVNKNRSGKQNVRPSNRINKRPKTWEEVAFLERQFKSDPSWCRKTVQECKKVLKLRTDQIYKWGYDKKKSIEKEKLYGETDHPNLFNDFPSLNTNVDELDLNEEVSDLLNFRRKR